MLPFEAAKVEELVFDQSSAESAAVLLQGARCFRRCDRVEVVACVEDAVAVETVAGSVHLIGARLQPHINDRSRLPAIFRRGILLQIELLNRIDRQNGRRIPGNARAIDEALARKGFAVIETVDDVHVVFGAKAVGARGRESATRIAHHAGPQLQQVLVIASIQRQVINLLVAEGSAEGRGGEVEHWDLFGHRDRL